jgi:hypothetical protein
MQVQESINASKDSPPGRMPLWLIKLTRYEYWPFTIFYIPAFFYWIILAVRSRSLLYFTAANPAIEMGGFFGESKSAILDQIPQQYRPKHICTTGGSYATENIDQQLNEAGLTYPLIAKPDKGERGNMVTKIFNTPELLKYLENSVGKVILQQFIPYETELGILYYRYPDGSGSGVSSVTTKKFFSVCGDGSSTISQLIHAVPRFRMHSDTMKQKYGEELGTILPAGSEMLLQPIGNHCRGTMFLDGSHLINERLIKVFDHIAEAIPGFHFGRFDLRVRSVEDLFNGDLMIMELNGTTSEPSHIYDPSFSILKAYSEVFRNMRIVQQISVQNMKSGIRPTPLCEFAGTVYRHFRSRHDS